MKKPRRFGDVEDDTSTSANTEEDNHSGGRMTKADLAAGMRRKVGKKEAELEGMSVKEWLSGLQLPGEYLDLFVKDGFDDLEAVRLITNDDLVEIGIQKTGHRKKVMHWVENENRKYNKY